MELPKEKIVEAKSRKIKPKSSKWIVALCAFTLIISLASAGFCAVTLADMPNEIDSYVQTHKSELKGDKGDTGPMGPRGFTGAAGMNGINSYAPTHCYSNNLFGSVTTDCY